MIPAIPFLAKLGLSSLGFALPWRFWAIAGLALAVGLFLWRFNYLTNAVKNYKAEVEIQQRKFDGNRRLVEELSESDNQIMYDQMQRAEDAGSRAKSWLRRQDPAAIKQGKTPPGYAKHLNEVR